VEEEITENLKVIFMWLKAWKLMNTNKQTKITIWI